MAPKSNKICKKDSFGEQMFKSCIIVQIFPKKAKFGQIASSPRIFTPTCKYHYTNIFIIFVTFRNSTKFQFDFYASPLFIVIPMYKSHPWILILIQMRKPQLLPDLCKSSKNSICTILYRLSKWDTNSIPF